MAKLRKFGDELGCYAFQCPGCGHEHEIWTDKPSPQGHVWGFNGSMDKPTFTPSILIKWGKYAKPDWEEPKDEIEGNYKWSGVCHTFITDGNIQYLGDCTHELAGQTVELPEIKNKES